MLINIDHGVKITSTFRVVYCAMRGKCVECSRIKIGWISSNNRNLFWLLWESVAVNAFVITHAPARCCLFQSKRKKGCMAFVRVCALFYLILLTFIQSSLSLPVSSLLFSAISPALLPRRKGAFFNNEILRAFAYNKEQMWRWQCYAFYAKSYIQLQTVWRHGKIFFYFFLLNVNNV